MIAAARAEPRWRLRLSGCVAVVAVAFHHSLGSLVQGLALETPLAYVGLAPLLAAALAFARVRPTSTAPEVDDRQIDAILAAAFLGAASAVELWLPSVEGSAFWVRRVDLLGVPLFGAGVVALVLGTRALWRLRIPLAFLLLCWPAPYHWLIGHAAGRITQSTQAAVGWLAPAIGLARPGGDGATFVVVHRGATFLAHVASACAGANGAVGFLLAGTFLASFMEGRRGARLLWMILGLACTWAANIGRLLVLFWVGRLFGEHAAVEVLHPVLGFGTFACGLALAATLMPLLGLHFRDGTDQRARPPASPLVGGPLSFAVAAVVAALLAVSNQALVAAGRLADATGSARLASIAQRPPQLRTWSAEPTMSVPWVTAYFGPRATWERWRFASQLGVVTGDVITSPRFSAFEAFTVGACYSFHGYQTAGGGRVSLPGGVMGNLVAFRDGRSGPRWTVLWWLWPVKVGGATWYERVTLLVPDAPGGSLASAIADRRRTLVGLGREVVAGTSDA